MKLTKQEQAALDRAAQIKDLLTRSQLAELAIDPQANGFAIKHNNLKQILVIRAEELNRRMLHNDLYQYAIRTRNRSDAQYYRVTSLETKTAHLRRWLVDAHKALADFEETPFAGGITADSKAWAKRRAKFERHDAVRAYQKQLQTESTLAL